MVSLDVVYQVIVMKMTSVMKIVSQEPRRCEYNNTEYCHGEIVRDVSLSGIFLDININGYHSL